LKRIGIKDQVSIVINKNEEKKKRPRTARHIHPGSSIKTFINQNLDDKYHTNDILNENTNTQMPNMNYDKQKHYVQLNERQEFNRKRLNFDKINNMGIYRPKTVKNEIKFKNKGMNE